MSPRITSAVTARVLAQLRHDPRTLGLLLAVPCVVLALLRWMFESSDSSFDALGPPLLALIPFIVMFLVASVTTLRERSSGTLERLLAMPMGKLDLLLGYAIAVLLVVLCVGVLGMHVEGDLWLLAVVAVADGVLGTVSGLFVSAFARTEFQAVQFMPAVVFPQILLCGLFVARDDLPSGLHAISNVLPLSYAVDATTKVSNGVTGSGLDSQVWADVAVVAGFVVALLALGAATLRRRTA
jgi:ABC-2 type transport system permease protein